MKQYAHEALIFLCRFSHIQPLLPGADNLLLTKLIFDSEICYLLIVYMQFPIILLSVAMKHVSR